MSKPTRESLAETRALLRAKRKQPAVAKATFTGTWVRGQIAAVNATTQTFGNKAVCSHQVEFLANQTAMNFAIKSRINAGAVAFRSEAGQ